jgi:hypothetical protein
MKVKQMDKRKRNWISLAFQSVFSYSAQIINFQTYTDDFLPVYINQNIDELSMELSNLESN